MAKICLVRARTACDAQAHSAEVRWAQGHASSWAADLTPYTNKSGGRCLMDAGTKGMDAGT